MFTEVNRQNMTEPFDEDDGVRPFVGRRELLEDIKTKLSPRLRLVQLYGQPMVGKASIARQVQYELTREAEDANQHLQSYDICCRGVCDWEDLLSNLKNSLGWADLQGKEAAILKRLKNLITIKPSHNFIFAFLKCEELGIDSHSNLAEKFDTLITKIIEVSKRVFVIVTTQKVFTFRGVKNITKKVPPMTADESDDFFRRCFTDVCVEPFLPAVNKFASGLPSLINEAADQLKINISENPDLTVEDFEEILQQHAEDIQTNSSKSILNVFDGLNASIKSFVIGLTIFQGSFGIEQLETVFDKRSSQAKAIVGKLEQCSQIVQDENKDRLRIHPAVVHYIRNSIPNQVKYDDTVRLRFVKLFGQVLKKVDNEISVRPEQDVYQYLHPDWLNFQQMLKEAIHCTQDTYEPFLQVATEAETVLIKFFPEEALNFYNSMVNASQKFGNDLQQAQQKWLLGRAKTRGRGTEYDDAMSLFKKALPVIQKSDNHYVFISLLADMGYNCYKQGDYETSLEYYKEALQEAAKHESSGKLLNRVFSIRCDTAIQLIFLNKVDSAEGILEETLRLITVVAPHHPSVPIMINSLGLICERARHDHENALRYYTSSLHERRKYANLAPADLVVALNNVAMQHSKRCNHYYALKLLNEALTIRKKLGWLEYHTGLTCLHLGRVHMALLHFEESLKYITKALEIFRTCTKYHHIQIAVLVAMAHSLAGLGRWDESVERLKEAVILPKESQKQCPSDVNTDFAKKHLFVVLQGHREQVKSFFESQKSSIRRQLSVTREKNENDVYCWLQKQLIQLSEAENMFILTDINSNSDVNGILSNCEFCSAMIDSGFNAYEMWSNVEKQVTSRATAFQQLCESPSLSSVVGIKSGIGRMSEIIRLIVQTNCCELLTNEGQASTDVDDKPSQHNQTRSDNSVTFTRECSLNEQQPSAVETFLNNEIHEARKSVLTSEYQNMNNFPTVSEEDKSTLISEKDAFDIKSYLKELPSNKTEMVCEKNISCSKPCDRMKNRTGNEPLEYKMPEICTSISQKDDSLGIKLSLLTQDVTSKTDNTPHMRNDFFTTADYHLNMSVQLNTSALSKTKDCLLNNNTLPQNMEQMSSRNDVVSSKSSFKKAEGHVAVWPPNSFGKLDEIHAATPLSVDTDENVLDSNNYGFFGNGMIENSSTPNSNLFSSHNNHLFQMPPNMASLANRVLTEDSVSLDSFVSPGCEPFEMPPAPNRSSVSNKWEGLSHREPTESDERDT